MSTNDLLTGEQLINLKSKSERDLPHIGEKEFAPSNSWLEKTQIENALIERKHLLEEQRVKRKAGKAKVLKKVGKHWESVGHHSDGNEWLYPEEALVLLETNCLELLLYEVPLSIERAYSTLINDKNGCNLDEYRVYSHLVRHGYRLFRHSSAVSVTRYEKDINLEQHVLNDKKLYSADCDKSKTAEKEISSVNNEPNASLEVSVESVVECRSVSENVEESSSSSCDIVAEKSVSSTQSVTDHQPGDKSEIEANVQRITKRKSDEEEDYDNDDDDENDNDDDDENDSNSEDSSGANWKRRPQQSNAPGSSSQVNAPPAAQAPPAPPVNQSSSTSTVSQQNPIPVRTSFVTVDEFLFPRPDRPDYRVVIDRVGNTSLNQELNRFYEEIEVIDLDSDKEDEPVAAPQVEVEVLPRADILRMLPVLKGHSFNLDTPDKYLPDGAQPVKINCSISFSLDDWTSITGDNYHQRNNSRQKNTPHVNKYLESRMSMRNSVIVQRTNPIHQQLTHTPHNRIHPMNFRGAPSPFMNNPMFNQFNNFTNNVQQMVSCMVDGTVKNEFQNQLFNQTIQFQQHLQHQAFNNQPIQFHQQIQQNFGNHPNNFLDPPSLSAPPFPHNNFMPPLMANHPNFNQMNNPAQADFLGFHVKTENNQGSSNQPNFTTPQNFNGYNCNANLAGSNSAENNSTTPEGYLQYLTNLPCKNGKIPRGRRKLINSLKTFLSSNANNALANQNVGIKIENQSDRTVDLHGNSAGTSNNFGGINNKTPEEYLHYLMNLRKGKKGKIPKKRRQLINRLKQFLSSCNSNTAKVLEKMNANENVIVKTENQTNRGVNVKTEKQTNSKNKDEEQMNNMTENDPLASQIIFDTTGGDPAVFVEDIPLVIPPPNTNNVATSKKAKKRKRKNAMKDQVRDYFSKRVKPDPDPVEEVIIISDTAQESSGPFRRENRRRYFGLTNGERLQNRESQPVDQVSTFGDDEVIHADVILIDQPRIKSESEPITIVDDSSQPMVAVCKPEPVEQVPNVTVDIKPQIENMEVVETSSCDAVFEVKEEIVETSTVVEIEARADKVADSTSPTSVPSDVPIKTESVVESSATPVEETSEVSAGEVDSWAQLKEKSPARAAPPQTSSSDSEDDSSSGDDPDVVQPILKPRDCQSLGTVLEALQVVKPASFPSDNIERLKITYDVYIPSPSFKKSTRGLPNYRLVVRSCSDPFLSAEQMAELNQRFEDCVPILLAVVLPDSISFSTSGLVNLPTLNEID
ncbi:hypothetical protein LSTR_LSTR006312 [Laodelphax striatellus]|uniref:tRNA-splicing endonuclease subunit Sen54 N-terminal domain-containing protein n=1 Tax=Laodelphax striatellus TaxID=195883 RepID=A0A482XPJ4_LAOST|nr:hypothetical protein LSTR_LSTR006312 [Laodelphax striatellus]